MWLWRLASPESVGYSSRLETHFSIVPVRGLLSLKMRLCVFSNSTVTITRNLGVCTCWSHLVEGEPRLEVKCLVWDLIAVECMVELALNFLDSLLPVLFIYYVQGTESRIFLPPCLAPYLPPSLPAFFLSSFRPSILSSKLHLFQPTLTRSCAIVMKTFRSLGSDKSNNQLHDKMLKRGWP